MDPFSPQDAEEARKWKFFQGYDGVPFRTRNDGAPDYKQTDPEHKKPQLTADMHVKQFNLQDAEQLAELEAVLDKCAKGKGYLSQKEVQFDDKIQGWRILLIWGDFFLEDPVETEHNEQNKQTFS